MNEEVVCRPSSRAFVTGSAAASSCSLSVQSEMIEGQSFPDTCRLQLRQGVMSPSSS
jgi:hypothetical protein